MNHAEDLRAFGHQKGRATRPCNRIDLRRKCAGRGLPGQPDHRINRTFAKAAAELMPSCGYHLLDGADATERQGTLSGGDFFVFPIDNLQETFGLAPIEAMAAGLPVIVSDWDGMKDTVTPDVGYRIPTEMPRAGLSTYVSLRHLGGTDTYLQYLSQMSAMTRIDVSAMPWLVRA